MGAPTAQARDATVVSFDGTKITTHYFPAAGLGAGKKAPTVMVGHGYGMTGGTDPESKSDTIFGQVGLGPLRRAGYNVLTWDARGFGTSGGQVEADSPQFEGRDVQAMIDFIAKQPETALDKPGDPRLGMNGVSYGGGIQLVSAAIDRRIDAITPTIAWNSLLTSLYKEQDVKQGWGSILGAAGGTAIAGGLANPMGPETGNLNPQIIKGVAEGLATGKFSAATVEFFRSRGLPGLVGKVRVPTLLLEGTADTLFTLDEARRNHAMLRSSGVPVRMVWFCGGHGLCTSGKGPSDLVEKSVLAWFGRYLDRNPKVDPGAPFTYVAQDGLARDGATFPPMQRGRIAGAGSGSLLITPGLGNGALISATAAPDGFNVDLPASQNALDAAGSPRLSLTYAGTGAPAETYVYAQMVDRATGLVLGNVAQPVPVTLDGATHSVALPMEAIAYHAAPGARLRLQIAPASSLYATQRTTGLLKIAKAEVDVPTVDLKAKPKLKVVVGATRGMRKARRGRNLFLRVRGSGDRLSNVKVILRDAKKRRVGSTKVFTLGLKSKRVRVRVNRRVKRGRYRFNATALSPERIDVTGGRTTRIR